MSTQFFLTKDSDRKWYIIDARDEILGRLATKAAELLRGKHKATFTPNLDSGDNVVIINASQVKLSNDQKQSNKIYYHHSGYPGGIKKETFEEAMEKHPEKVIFNAIAGMIPKNKLGKSQLTRLRVYSGSEHKHTQEMTVVTIGGLITKSDAHNLNENIDKLSGEKK